MSIQHQSTARAETNRTSKVAKKQKIVSQHRKINKSKSQISEESGSTTSLKEKIICYLFCCCHYGKSPRYKITC